MEREKETDSEFVKLCGEYVCKVENDLMDELWLRYMKTRADPEATRKETNVAGNEFVREVNRIGITALNPDED